MIEKSIKIRLFFIIVLMLYSTFYRSVSAQESVSQRDSRIKTALRSQDINVRRDAYYEIRRSRELAVSFLGYEVEEAQFWKDTNSEGLTAAGLYLIQTFRIKEVVPQLVEHVDWSIDTQTYRPGMRRDRDAHYAVVKSLISIAGPDVKQYVVKRLRVASDAKQRLLCLWILHQTEGESLPFILDKEIERNVFDNEKANLNAAKAALPTLDATWSNFLFTGKLEAVPTTPGK